MAGYYGLKQSVQKENILSMAQTNGKKMKHNLLLKLESVNLNVLPFFSAECLLLFEDGKLWVSEAC